jgi:hypothetical protein
LIKEPPIDGLTDLYNDNEIFTMTVTVPNPCRGVSIEYQPEVQEVIRMFVLKGYKYGEAKYEGRLYSTSQNPRRSTLRRTSVSRRGRRIRAADRESPVSFPRSGLLFPMSL